MKLKDMTVDAVSIEQGSWVDNVPEMEGLRLKVRGIGNKDWRKLQNKLQQNVPRKKRVGGQLDPDEMDRITSICLRDACLLDWDGLEGDDGQPQPYDKKLADKLLSEPQYRKFRDAVIWAATVVGEQEDLGHEEDSGN